MEKKKQYFYINGRYVRVGSTGTSFKEVETLPEVGEEGIIYLLPGSGGGTTELMQEITWAELKNLRDNSNLIPGQQYRITDYQCTTTQLDTHSAGHQFDIIVVADDEKTLNENARAIKHEGDTYFEDCKLEAWKLKYCLDNDTSRFAWAYEETKIINLQSYLSNGRPLVRQPSFDNRNPYFADYRIAWGVQEDVEDADSNNFIYSKTEDVDGQEVFNANDDEFQIAKAVIDGGKGVIYYMKDEWNNECPYDFKNIMFKRCQVNDERVDTQKEEFDLTGQYLGIPSSILEGLSNIENTDVWCYTFNFFKVTEDNEILANEAFDASLYQLNSYDVDIEGGGYEVAGGVFNNIIKEKKDTLYIDDEYIGRVFVLNNIVLHCYNNTDDSDGHIDMRSIIHNVFAAGCFEISALGKFLQNKFNAACHELAFAFRFNNNTFGNNCYCNTFGNNCYDNTFGESCCSNTFGNSCYNNIFGNSCRDNIFNDGCNFNTFGNNCYDKTFGRNCLSNTFGNNCGANIFGDNCEANTFGNGCWANTFSNDCKSNTFGNKCKANTFGNGCNYNILLDDINYTTIDEYARWNIFENGVSYVNLRANESGSYSNRLQNITIRQGVCGTEDNYKTIIESRGLTHDVTYRASGAEDKTI